jgi:hypothetical protein
MQIFLKAYNTGTKFPYILRKTVREYSSHLKNSLFFIFLLGALIRDIRAGLEFVIYVLFGGHGSLHCFKSQFFPPHQVAE